MDCKHNPQEHDLHTLCVSLVPIFNHLAEDALRVIADKAVMRTYERGQFVHRRDELSDQLFIVHRGKVKIYHLSESGKEQLVRILQPGDFAGELALFSATTHDSYAEIMQTSQICTIHRDDIQKLLRRYPDIGLHVMSALAQRLGTSEKQTAAIATQPINTRIGLYLADLSEHEASLTFDLPMSRKHLASYLGTTPETISRRLGEFEEAELIQQTGQRKITILDLDALLLL